MNGTFAFFIENILNINEHKESKKSNMKAVFQYVREGQKRWSASIQAFFKDRNHLFGELSNFDGLNANTMKGKVFREWKSGS